jgi:uncharacterized membrane protein YdbT with pleckstrin-like domain
MLFTHLDLDPGEKIIHEVRRHWYVFLWHIAFSIMLIVLPVLVYLVGLGFLPPTLVSFVTDYFPLTLFIYAIWFLIIWVLLFLQWTNYYLDVWYITERRIIDIQQKGIFHREVSNLRFDKIQDITVEVRGVIATFLKFGDLRVQTASEDSRDFVLKDATRPEEVRKIIFEIHNKSYQVAGHGSGTPGVDSVTSIR